jgi:hypothetical protein
MNTVNSDRLLESLRKGGLRISGRRTGKTRAICQLAHELMGKGPAKTDPVIIVPKKEYFDIAKDTWRELYGGEPMPMVAHVGEMHKPDWAVPGSDRRVLVDEWFECVKAGMWGGSKFFAAVATPPFTVEVIPGISPSMIKEFDRCVTDMGEASALRECAVVESRDQLVGKSA